ncbi:hypothetical protein Dvina_17860 [Dactylosporangium vinaceum]|uniref:Uncharacterized protein n=1 Tax=Dactylosporangium vinaceum TaxID=53362 RepID=A0ABV5M373_9ACTN|nr:hypothetical protein [Dactylosporangium vinaceum]UAB99759.1 hypothetical protein Dvina_17860 [Dactylosporangium vinaceum]
MIVHTLIYRFPDDVSPQSRAEFFQDMGSLTLGTGLVRGYDHKPHLWLPADNRARGLTAAAIAQFTCDDLKALETFSELPEVYDFVTTWKEKLRFEAAYANHEVLTPYGEQGAQPSNARRD